LTERDARRIYSIVLGGMHDEPAPATAYVQQALARLETKLSTYEIEFCFLRDIERIIRRAEVRARINHPPVQPQLIEGVADVVVKVDRRCIAHRSVPGPELFCPLRESYIGQIIVGGTRQSEHQTNQPRNRDRRAEPIADHLSKI